MTDSFCLARWCAQRRARHACPTLIPRRVAPPRGTCRPLGRRPRRVPPGPPACPHGGPPRVAGHPARRIGERQRAARPPAPLASRYFVNFKGCGDVRRTARSEADDAWGAPHRRGDPLLSPPHPTPLRNRPPCSSLPSVFAMAKLPGWYGGQPCCPPPPPACLPL